MNKLWALGARCGFAMVMSGGCAKRRKLFVEQDEGAEVKLSVGYE